MVEVYGDATFTSFFYSLIQQKFIGLYCMSTSGLDFLFVFDEETKYREMNNTYMVLTFEGLRA